MPAGYAVPIRLTIEQERYCRRAIAITRFRYNLCVIDSQALPLA